MKNLYREITLRHEKYLYKSWRMSLICYHSPFPTTHCNGIILCTMCIEKFEGIVLMSITLE